MNNVVEGVGQGSFSTKSKVLKNTYLLLGANIGFSALMAIMSTKLNIGYFQWYIMLPVYFAILWGVHKTKNSSAGLLMTFVLTGFLGITLGPIINSTLGIRDGALILAQSLFGTCAIFITLSFYTIKNKLIFSSGLKPIVSVVIWVTFIVSILNIVFFNSSVLSVLLSSIFMVLSSAIIIWQTSEIVNEGETNYISATVTLFVQIFNLFVSLINILTFSNRD